MAAGTSNRLRPLTTHIPKTLLRLGEKTILEHILDTAYRAGLRHFDIVTGHGHRAVEEFACEYQKQHADVHLSLLYNDVYDSAGNVVSLATAKEVFDEDFIIINSDTIFHEDILKALITSEHTNAMMIDDVKKLGSEEMKVHIDDNENIIRIHKSLDPQSAAGEYVGIMKLSAQHKKELLDSLNKMIGEDRSVYYEDAIQKMIDDHRIPVKKISTQGLPVMEIDTHQDLEDAHDLITRIV